MLRRSSSRRLAPGLLWALACGLAWPLAAPAFAWAEGAVVLDRVVAVVDDQIILASELEHEIVQSEHFQRALAELGQNATEDQIARIEEQVRPLVLDDMIDDLLVRKEGARFQIEASDDDLERYLGNLARQHGYDSIDALRADVERSGVYGTWAQYQDDLRKDIVVYKTLATLAAPTVTDAQMRAYYRTMTKDEQAAVVIERFQIQPASAAPAAKDVAYQRAQALARRLRAGAGAQAVAQELGAQPPERETLHRGDMAPKVEDMVFAAKPKQVVGPLDTGRGYAVIRVVEHQAGSALSFEEAKDRIMEHLYQEAAVKAEREFKRGLRAKAHVDIRL